MNLGVVATFILTHDSTLASCTETGWIDTARTELQRKIEL